VMDNTGARIPGASVTITAFDNRLGAKLTTFETKKVMATTGGVSADGTRSAGHDVLPKVEESEIHILFLNGHAARQNRVKGWNH